MLERGPGGQVAQPRESLVEKDQQKQNCPALEVQQLAPLAHFLAWLCTALELCARILAVGYPSTCMASSSFLWAFLWIGFLIYAFSLFLSDPSYRDCLISSFVVIWSVFCHGPLIFLVSHDHQILILQETGRRGKILDLSCL